MAPRRDECGGRVRSHLGAGVRGVNCPPAAKRGFEVVIPSGPGAEGPPSPDLERGARAEGETGVEWSGGAAGEGPSRGGFSDADIRAHCPPLIRPATEVGGSY